MAYEREEIAEKLLSDRTMTNAPLRLSRVNTCFKLLLNALGRGDSCGYGIKSSPNSAHRLTSTETCPPSSRC